MKNIKKKSAILLAAIFIVLLNFCARAATDNDMLESRAREGAGQAVLRLVKRLPEVRKARGQALKIASTMPEYQGRVELPDSELIYSWIKALCATPHRRPGTKEDQQAEQWLAEQLRGLGLQNVSLDPVPLTVWSADKWSLSIDGKEIPSFYVVNTGFTKNDGVTAPMVYIGTGKKSDFAKAEVKGKIVVADVPFPKMPTGLIMKLFKAPYALSDPDNWIKLGDSQYLPFVRMNFSGGFTEKNAPESDVYWQAQKRGAAAICLILRDQPTNSNTHYGPYDGIMKPLPALWIGKYDGERLRDLAKQGRTATLTLNGTTEPGVMHNVWGTLPGMSDEVILVTSHHDAPFQGAVEDAAGAAQVLVQAWSWSRIPKEQRPKTMIFILDGGHFYGSLGAHTFAKEHKDIMQRTRILITLEHLAAKEVEEKDKEYAETGRLAFTVMFTSQEPETIAAALKAIDQTRPRVTAAIPADFFGPAPTSDAGGYVMEAKLPVISWIGCPYYLLEAHDTLDKIDQPELKHIAETASALVKIFMAGK